MTRPHLARALVVALALAPTVFPVLAQASEKSAVTAAANLKWTPAGVPGVSTAAVQGDMAKGPSHFYLKYDAGFAAPVHHHSPDHYATVVSGIVVLSVDGKEHRLPAGSYFELTGKAKHGARVEGNEACVMFIDARGPWDVVMADTAAKK